MYIFHADQGCRPEYRWMRCAFVLATSLALFALWFEVSAICGRLAYKYDYHSLHKD